MRHCLFMDIVKACVRPILDILLDGETLSASWGLALIKKYPQLCGCSHIASPRTIPMSRYNHSSRSDVFQGDDPGVWSRLSSVSK
jgi:hypothetical protein